MRFILYCDRDPRDLGIEDWQGNWDMGKFLDHIRRCRDCARYLDILSPEAYELMEIVSGKEKGSHANDRP